MVADLGYDFGSLYVGGGTPTILLDELCQTIDLARELFSIREVSSETSPNHLGPEWPSALDGRIQRMSVGVQSFDDAAAQADGPLRQVRLRARSCSRSSRRAAAWFHSLNVDMIFNFPSQTEAMLRHDVEMLKETGCNQTTFYPLMASPGQRSALSSDRSRRHDPREALLRRHRRGDEPRVRARQRVDVLAHEGRDDRRVHRRLRGVRRHRVRRVLVPRRHPLREHLLAGRLRRARARRAPVGHAGRPPSTRSAT